VLALEEVEPNVRYESNYSSQDGKVKSKSRSVGEELGGAQALARTESAVARPSLSILSTVSIVSIEWLLSSRAIPTKRPPSCTPALLPLSPSQANAILAELMRQYFHPPLRDVSLTTLLQALSDPCRFSIVRALAHGEECACHEIALDVSKATRSHHFDVLREAGLIFTRTEGTKCMTSLRIAELDKRFPGLLDLIRSEKKHSSPALRS
jgi:DNA-binding transcriptional ArsR family regulator